MTDRTINALLIVAALLAQVAWFIVTLMGFALVTYLWFDTNSTGNGFSLAGAICASFGETVWIAVGITGLHYFFEEVL